MEAFAVESYIQTYPGQDVDNARIFSRCHITPNTQFSTMDINATYSMVEAGLGIGINNQDQQFSLAGPGRASSLKIGPDHEYWAGLWKEYFPGFGRLPSLYRR